jgi:hypothetical protein
VGDVLTVERAVNGTYASSHTVGAKITPILGEQYFLNTPAQQTEHKAELRVKNSLGETAVTADEFGGIRYKGMLLPLSALP